MLFTVEDAEACFDNHLRRMERTDASDEWSKRMRRIGRIDSMSSEERQSLPLRSVATNGRAFVKRE